MKNYVVYLMSSKNEKGDPTKSRLTLYQPCTAAAELSLGGLEPVVRRG